MNEKNKTFIFYYISSAYSLTTCQQYEISFFIMTKYLDIN